MAQIEELQKKYSDTVNFVIVYIKEAHPDDEWQMESNEESGVIYSQPKSTEERRALARAFIDQMDVETETLLDDIDNTAMACYAAWPERLYVIGTDGRIIYKGGMGQPGNGCLSRRSPREWEGLPE